MANIINMNSRAICKKILNYRPLFAQLRSISTSDKKKDGSIATTDSKENIPDFSMPKEIPKDIPDFTKPYSQNWVSYGFDRYSEKEDLDGMHSIFFFVISLIMVGGGFFLAYFPDFKDKDWFFREAALELRRREKYGLPLVDKNFIDPAKIKLPTDEELGDRDIII